MLKRAIAVLVLLLVAVIAVRFVIGLVTTALWIVAVVALIAAVLWAWSTVKSAKARRSVKRSPAKDLTAAPARDVTAAPAEDPVAVEMRRITEQLREQGRINP